MHEKQRKAPIPLRQHPAAHHVLILALAILLLAALAAFAAELRSLAWAPEVTDQGTGAGPQGESTLGSV
jgi:hypothetical protein